MFPNSLALTNCPQMHQQTFDIKCQPPQAITIETLHKPHKCPPNHGNISNNKPAKQQQQHPFINTEFENKMLAMKLIARNRITNYSRQEILSTSREAGALNPVSEVRKEDIHKGETGPDLQTKSENKHNSKARTEIVRLKNILEEQQTQLESIIDPSKAKKSTIQGKKSSLSQQMEEKELSLKINRIISSLTREVSSLERQVSRVTSTTGHTNELGHKLLSTYQFSMSFIQTYHNEYQSRLTESTQNNFKEKLSKLTKSLANCVTQLSEFPNFDFPMPEIGPKPVGAKQKKSKVQNQKKNILLPKKSLKNAHPRLPQYIEQKPIEPSRHYIRKAPTQASDPQMDTHHNLSSDESLISLLASKPGHSRLSSPSNSRIQLETVTSRQTGFTNKRHGNISAKRAIIRENDFNDLAQETIEELIDEQISDVICSIELSEVISHAPPSQNFQSLPELIENLDYYLSTIDSYQNMVMSVEKNLASLDSPIERKPRAQDTMPTAVEKEGYREDKMIVIPRPEQIATNIHRDADIPAEKDSKMPTINPVFIQNLSDDKYKVMRHNRLHQPSIRFALRHNLLDSLKEEILNSSMDNVSEQIFQTLDNYVEKNFFDEFLKTPETMNLVQNIIRRTTGDSQTVETLTQAIQTEKQSKNVQIQSVLSSPTATNSTILSQAYSSDFPTDKSTSESTPHSEHSYSPIIQYESPLVDNPNETDFSENIPTQIEQGISLHSNTEDREEFTVLASNITDGISMVEETVEMLSPSLESPLPGILSPLALTPVRDIPAAETTGQNQPTPEHLEHSDREKTDTTFSPFLDTDYSSDGALIAANTTDARVPLKSPYLSPLTSKEPSMSELAVGSVLRKRSDIVCLDIDDILILPDDADPPTYSLTISGEYDQPSRLRPPLREYSSTFTHSNSTLDSISGTQLERETGPIAPQTPISQDSLDNTRVHSSSRGTPDTPTDSIEEDISVSLTN